MSANRPGLLKKNIFTTKRSLQTLASLAVGSSGHCLDAVLLITAAVWVSVCIPPAAGQSMGLQSRSIEQKQPYLPMAVVFQDLLCLTA